MPGTLHRKRAAAVMGLVLVLAMAVTCDMYLARPPRAITSIAVLPFRNLSGDDAVDYLSDGLAESLIDRLSQLPGVKVVARSSSFQYKSRRVDLREVASSLGVQAVIEGDITRRDDEVQVRVDLVDAAARRHLWGERYQRKSAGPQSMQEDIARSISEKLHVRLTAGQQQQFAKRVTQNPEA
jgi:TolB-like protein